MADGEGSWDQKAEDLRSALLESHRQREAEGQAPGPPDVSTRNGRQCAERYDGVPEDALAHHFPVCPGRVGSFLFFCKYSNIFVVWTQAKRTFGCRGGSLKDCRT